MNSGTISVSPQDYQTFSRFSKWAGERWDWVQAGGGNTGLKTDKGDLIVKASGISLTEVEDSRGHVSLKLAGIQSMVREIHEKIKTDGLLNKGDRENLAKTKLQEWILPGQTDRPSIETYLHAFLFKYTLHIHPVGVVSALSTPQSFEYSRACGEELGRPWIYLDYATPGIDLALLLLKEIEKHLEKSDEMPKLIFMKNHGILISSNGLREVRDLTEASTQFFEKLCGLDMSGYAIGHKISALVNLHSMSPQVVLYGDHPLYTKAFEKKFDFSTVVPVAPDDFVYWGKKVCQISQLNEKEINDFFQEHGLRPKVIIFERKIYFVGGNLRKCREVEEVFRSRLTLAFVSSLNQHVPLAQDELVYLGQWEAEKYRQKI